MADALILVAALAGAIAAAATATRRPFVALGILFVLSSISRVTLDTPVGTMRLEQPAIAAVALVLLATGQWRRLLRLDRTAIVIALGFAIYLAVLGIASALRAPHPIDSLRLVVWLAVSMVGGLVAFILVVPDPEASMLPFAVGGALKGAVGVAVAVVFLVAGPDIAPGIQEADGILPRVHAFTWEANLYASFLAICAPLALEAARRASPGRALLLLGPVLIGLPLGMTRGAYLGLLAGLGVYALIRIVVQRRPTDLPRLGAATLGLFLIGLVAANVLLPNAIERTAGIGIPGAVSPSSGPAGSGGPGSNAPPPKPLPSLRPYPDTVGFRLERVPVAFEDLRSSPIIGLGAESFGQRHADPSQDGAPDHIAILAVAALYESGVVGAAAMFIAFAVLLFAVWQCARAAGRVDDPNGVGVAAAFAGAICAMLVCYQATNALHFAMNWLIIGAAAAATLARAERSAA